MLGLTDKILENKTLMYSAVALAIIVACLLVLLLFRLTLGRRPRLAGGRARQQRLGLVDAFNLDRQRQLIIVRRDNVEHMLMVGGPNDVLIESQIVRAEPARELSRTRDKEPDLRPALPAGLGAEPAAVSIVPPAPVTVPAANTPIVPPLASPPQAPPAMPPLTSVDRPSVAAPEPASEAVPPVIAEEPPRAPQNNPRPVPPPVKEAPARAPLFPLPPRRPMPPLAKPPSPGGDVRVEPNTTGGPLPQQGGGPDAAAPGSLTRPQPLPPRAPSFLRPPPQLRPAPRPAEPANGAPPIRGDAPGVASDAALPLSSAPPIAAPQPAAPPRAEPVDPFDSIEEEMAKLLGRSSDKS